MEYKSPFQNDVQQRTSTKELNDELTIESMFQVFDKDAG